MEFRDNIKQSQDDLIARLQGCIQIPSVYADDGSGHPYGAQVHRCLTYMLARGKKWWRYCATWM